MIQHLTADAGEMQEKIFLLAPFKESFYNFMKQKAISFLFRSWKQHS